MTYTALTLDTLTRFTNLVDVDAFTAEQVEKIEHCAYCANTKEHTKEAAFDWFAYLIKMYFGIDLKALEEEKSKPAAEIKTLTRYERIKAHLDSMGDCALIQIHNEYCGVTNHGDDYIYLMDEFDDIMENEKPWEIARKCFYGKNFNPNDTFFYFNGYANLESMDYISDNSPIYTSEIADYIDRTGDSLGDDEIDDILDSEEVE